MDELTILKTVFEHALSTPIGEKIATFMFAWFFVRRAIKAQFQMIDTTLKALNESLIKIETAHSLRITLLETEFRKWKEEKDGKTVSA